jgi:hypothetical protein
LIQRFIDPAAEFVFVDDPAEVPPDATPFDMRGVPLSHHQGDCSFETFLRRYGLRDPGLWKIAEIVHEADLEDDRYEAPEAPGLDSLIRGLGLRFEDAHLIGVTNLLFDALYGLQQPAALQRRERL